MPYMVSLSLLKHVRNNWVALHFSTFRSLYVTYFLSGSKGWQARSESGTSWTQTPSWLASSAWKPFASRLNPKFCTVWSVQYTPPRFMGCTPSRDNPMSLFD